MNRCPPKAAASLAEQEITRIRKIAKCDVNIAIKWLVKQKKIQL